MPPRDPQAGGADWLKPRTEQQGLQRYVQTLRERRWLVIITTLLTLAAAAVYLALAPPVYKARAQLLVTPVSSSDNTYTGLGLIRDSNDPTRDVTTGAELVHTTPVAARVKRQLGLKGSTNDILSKVTAEPVAQSNLVTVTANGSTPTKAQQLANAFAEQTVADRTDQLHSQLDVLLPPLRARVAGLPAGDRTGPDSLSSRLAVLEALRSGKDPTITLETAAYKPHARSSPRTKLTLAAALLAGLILGIGGAFALEALDPRLRREEQLREVYSLPVLARIPRDAHGRRGRALPPVGVSPQTVEAFRTLRAMLVAIHGDDSVFRSVLVTSASPGEGKTSVAINLAYSIALSGKRVILMEADFRRPTFATTLGIQSPRAGIDSVLLQQSTLQDALVTVEGYGPDLQLLLVERAGDWMVDSLSLPAAQSIVREAESIADYVVIDSPPLTQVIDALPLARQVDDVLLVARLGRTNLRKLAELGEVLDQNGIRPVGTAIVGVERSARDSYYYVTAKEARAKTVVE